MRQNASAQASQRREGERRVGSKGGAHEARHLDAPLAIGTTPRDNRPIEIGLQT